MNRDEYIYYSFMKKATEDSYISYDESGLILILEDRIGLSDDRMDTIMGMIEEDVEPDLSQEEMGRIKDDRSNHIFELSIYKDILKEAVKDENIRKDEFELLETLRRIIGVSEKERRNIYNEIKEEIREEMEEELHPTFLDRVKAFTGLGD